MKTMAAREAKNHFGLLMDEIRREPILIERNGRRAAVVLSPEEYDSLIAAEDAAWGSQAQHIVATSEPLSPEETLKALREFLAEA